MQERIVENLSQMAVLMRGDVMGMRTKQYLQLEQGAVCGYLMQGRQES